MSQTTDIQWCDSTVNPVMGCSGCELWSEKRHTCYAGQLHNRYKGNSGFSLDFLTPKLFNGRMAEAARWEDLSGTKRENKPWLNGLPRLIFVSDMGDALSEKDAIDSDNQPIEGGVPFEFLKKEIIDNAFSDNGMRHRWLWLTKRPKRLGEFARWLKKQDKHPWPKNIWVGTSITGPRAMDRVKDLRNVGGIGVTRFLSVEPLWEAVSLDSKLDGISWVIVGGESAQAAEAKEFKLEWAEKLRDECASAKVPFFLKQLGTRPTHRGKRLQLLNRHGGDWSAWPKRLRIRKMPVVKNNAGSADLLAGIPGW